MSEGDAPARAHTDGDAWGFCYVCAFEQPVGLDGLLGEHMESNTYDPRLCPGSKREPTVPPSPECKPVKLVNLKKSYAHLAQRKRRMEWSWPVRERG